MDNGEIVLGVNNDSASDASVLSVGYFDSANKISWVSQVGDYQTNKRVNYPISVKARSIYAVSLLSGRDIPTKSKRFGYCVQLATGRIYVLRSTAHMGITFELHCASLLSRLSGGRYVTPSINRVRLPTRL